MLGGHFCDVMLGLITEPLRFCVINRFLGFFSPKRSKIRWNTVKLFRFEAASIQDMVTKFEPNLGFEKSFISVLALKVSLFWKRDSRKLFSKNRAELQRMRAFYKLDFDADMDEEVLR